MAYVWSDRDRRYFIASAGSMAKGKSQERICWREVGNEDGERMAARVHIELPMPKASQIYFEGCGAIDQHNQTREMVGIDKRFRTTDWAKQVNLGILGMLFTDAWLLYKACWGDKLKINPKKYFLALADELIDFEIDEGTTTTCNTKKRMNHKTVSLNTCVLQCKTSKKRKTNPNHSHQS